MKTYRKWLVMQDASNWHRAVLRDSYLNDPLEVIAGDADTYQEACRIADQLNQIAEVQDG